MQGFKEYKALGDDMNKILPRVGVSKVIGFLEVVHDNNDSAETIQLAADLDLEIDDLLPVLDAAELLDFIEVKSGRVSLTPTGKKFVENNLLERRGLLRDQVTKIDTIKQVLDALKTKKNKKMSKKNLLKALELAKTVLEKVYDLQQKALKERFQSHGQ